MCGKSNAATQIAVFVSHCSSDIKPIAISLRDTSDSVFPTLDAFLVKFRTEIFPQVLGDVRSLFVNMRQGDQDYSGGGNSSETAIQTYHRVSYLLNVLGWNEDDFIDDFLDKLKSPLLLEKVRFLPRSGKSLREFAVEVNEVEREVSGMEREVNGVKEEVLDDHFQGEHSQGYSQPLSHPHAMAATTYPDSYPDSSSRGQFLDAARARAATWELGREACWHCFLEHPRDDKSCRQDPCWFCEGNGHLSLTCDAAPESREDFDSVILR